MRYLILIVLSFYVATDSYAGSIESFEPSYNGLLDAKCDVQYSNKSIHAIAEDIEEQCGIRTWLPIDTMDISFQIIGNEEEIIHHIQSLSAQYPFAWRMQRHNMDTNETWLGLECSNKNFKTVIEQLKKRFPVKNIEQRGIRIDLQSNQIPCWELLGKIAQQSNLEFYSLDSMLDSMFLRFTRNDDRTLLAFQKTGPFYLYVSKLTETEKLALTFLYMSENVKDVEELDIKNVCLRFSEGKREVGGRTISTPESSGRVEWISNDPIQWEKGMVIEGLIQGPVLTREYHIENLGKNASIKGNDLAITAQITENFQIPEGSSGVYFEPDEMEGEWVCVNISVVDNLSREEKLFLQEIDKKRLERRQLSNEETTRYNILRKEKMAVIKVYSLGKPNESYRPKKYGGVYFFNSVTGIDETTLYFDSVQDGKEIFPLFLELRRYEPKQFEFSVEVP